jgi:general secretion pathway protein D
MMTRNEQRRIGLLCVAAVCLAVMAGTATAAPDRADAPQEGLIKLNFPEQLKLKDLIDYVSRRNNVNFLYDVRNVTGQSVTLIAPQKVPADSLMALLGSTLRMKGLQLTRDEETGMLRITRAKSVTETSSGIGQADPNAKDLPGKAVTRVFSLTHAQPKDVEAVIKPFLSAATANVINLPQHRRLIVTDHAGNMKRLRELVSLVDRPARKVHVEFVDIRNLEASDMVSDVNKILQGAAKAKGTPREMSVTLFADKRSNRVVVIGTRSDVAEAVELIASLDAPLNRKKNIYAFEHASAGRVDELVKKLIGKVAAKQFYASAVDETSNILIVTATPEVHKQIARVAEMVDKPAPQTQSPIRFYKLENAKATDVLGTIQSIQGEGGLEGVSLNGQSGGKGNSDDGLVIEGPTPRKVNRASGGGFERIKAGSGRGAVKLDDVRVMADEGTNTIIVIGPPSMQGIYRQLVERLDVRRPQVLIEATVVTLDTTDDFALGVEVSYGDTVDGGSGEMLTFSSFGLSTVDAGTGRLAISPGTGFNGTLISADLADVVIKALQTDKRAKVVSRPSVLINDNATGTLVSESEEPFASVNASSTVATTSFAGYTSAGTKMVITPQISEGDHLKLEYEITLSSFGEDASESLPPSRQTNSLASEATIPDGHTIVVGGLSREDFDKTVDRVPLLGEIPGLELLFSNRDVNKRQTTLFVFIRAVILRDDKFRRLKRLSRQAVREAKLDTRYPHSEPITIP